MRRIEFIAVVSGGCSDPLQVGLAEVLGAHALCGLCVCQGTDKFSVGRAKFEAVTGGLRWLEKWVDARH